MKRYRLSSGEQRRLQRGESDGVAEEIVASEYQAFSRDFQDHPVYDLAGQGDESVAQVKSTFTEIGNAYPAPGRFRLFEDQHGDLLERDRGGSAYYVFVVFEPSGRDVVAHMVRRKPADVGRIVGARGGWNKSGHEDMGRQYKLPPEAVGL